MSADGDVPKETKSHRTIIDGMMSRWPNCTKAACNRSIEREIDSKQWSIGGIYNITSRIRLNADAFYGVGENRGSALSVQPPLTSPCGERMVQRREPGQRWVDLSGACEFRTGRP